VGENKAGWISTIIRSAYWGVPWYDNIIMCG